VAADSSTDAASETRLFSSGRCTAETAPGSVFVPLHDLLKRSGPYATPLIMVDTIPRVAIVKRRTILARRLTLRTLVKDSLVGNGALIDPNGFVWTIGSELPA
jgi:hypothetical protein